MMKLAHLSLLSLMFSSAGAQPQPPPVQVTKYGFAY
jgi:hypothetical protein